MTSGSKRLTIDWRAALDGKSRVTRLFRSPAAKFAAGQFFASGYSLDELTQWTRSDGQAVGIKVANLARAMVGIMAAEISRVEPFYWADTVMAEVLSEAGVDEFQGGLNLVTDLSRMFQVGRVAALHWFESEMTLEAESIHPDGREWRIKGLALFIIDGRPNGPVALFPVSIIDERAAGHPRVQSAGGLAAHVHCPLELGPSGRRVTFGSWFSWVTAVYGEGTTDYFREVWPIPFLFRAARVLDQTLEIEGETGSPDKGGRLRPPPSRVRVVRWRKANYNYGPDHVPGRVEWSCRWRVRPHTRVYHRGQPNEKRVQVRGHIRGPEDKELRERDVVVNLVER